MENPATWGEAEWIVHRVRQDKDRQDLADHLAGDFRCGLSLERQITDALRDAGLLPPSSAVKAREQIILKVWEQLRAPEVAVLREEAPEVVRFCQELHERVEHSPWGGQGPIVVDQATLDRAKANASKLGRPDDDEDVPSVE